MAEPLSVPDTPTTAMWETHGYWVWLWLQSNSGPWIVDVLHENGLDPDRWNKFHTMSLAASGDPKEHLILLETMLQLKYRDAPMIPFPVSGLSELIAEARVQISKGIKTVEVVAVGPPIARRRPMYRGRHYNLPQQSINPAAKRQVRLQGRTLSQYVPGAVVYK